MYIIHLLYALSSCPGKFKCTEFPFQPSLYDQHSSHSQSLQIPTEKEGCQSGTLSSLQPPTDEPVCAYFFLLSFDYSGENATILIQDQCLQPCLGPPTLLPSQDLSLETSVSHLHLISLTYQYVSVHLSWNGGEKHLA